MECKTQSGGMIGAPYPRVSGSCRSVNLMKWKCLIPGKENTDWAGGQYEMSMEFSEDYPAKPPKVLEVVVCYLT